MEQKKNTLGIIGLCVGWVVPLAGLVLGIIALARGEKDVWMGTLSILLAVVIWVIWLMFLLW
jgi:hypothetical protein